MCITKTELEEKVQTLRSLKATERAFAAKDYNYSQLFCYMRRKELDNEEWYDILIVPYLNAVKKYHGDEHLQKYGFTHTLYEILDTAVNDYIKSHGTTKQVPDCTGCKQLSDHIQHQYELGKPVEIAGNLYWLKDAKQNLKDIMDDIESTYNEERGLYQFIVPIKRTNGNGEVTRFVIIQTDKAETAMLIAIEDFQNQDWWVDADYENYKRLEVNYDVK